MTTTQTQKSGIELRDVGVFHGLGPAEVEALLAGAERLEVAAGAAIYREGDAVSGFYVLEKGKVVVRRRTANGVEHDLATLEERAVFGEMGLLVGGRPRAATVIAAEPSVVRLFPEGRFRELVERGEPAMSKVLMNMARVLAHRLDMINGELLKLVDAKGGSSKAKLAELAAFKEKLYKEWAF